MKKHRISHFILTRFADLRHNERGVAFIEMALAVPLLFILLFGTLELCNYIIVSQRLEKTTDVLANIVTQLPPQVPLPNGTKANQLTDQQMCSVFLNILPQMLTVVNGGTIGGKKGDSTGQYFVSIADFSINASGTATLNWRYTSNDAGNTTRLDINNLNVKAGFHSIYATPEGLSSGEAVMVEMWYSYNVLSSLLKLPGVPFLSYYHNVAMYAPRANGSNSSISSQPLAGAKCLNRKN